MRVRLLCLFIFSFLLKGVWSSVFFTPDERAYLFHIVKNNEVLDNSLGRYVFYSGKMFYLDKHKTVVDYDTLEQIIVLEPTLLRIDFEGIKRAPQSILAETASKMALWKLIKILKEPSSDFNKNDYRDFRKVFQDGLPVQAFKSKDRTSVHKPVMELLDPGLSFLDKRDLIHELDDVKLEDKRAILVALDQAYKDFTHQLTERYFEQLGGVAKEFDNILLAAGEGSSTYGMMEEFEKDERGKPKKSSPIGIGLFTYQYLIKKPDKGARDIYVKSDPIVEYGGYVDPENTSLHLSLWGFNAFFQTTVVIKTGGKSYLLYASRDSRQLSPDSAYSHGKTYHDHIREIEEDIIPNLRDKLYGKGGYVSSLMQWQERIDYNHAKIGEAELELREHQMSKNRKKYKKAQDKFINYTKQYDNAKYRFKVTNRVVFAKENELEFYEDELYYMKSNLGSHAQAYTLQDSVFVFEDGSTFDPFTQDFHFKSIPQGEFTVRLISVGSRAMSKSVDEVQLLVNVIKKPEPHVVKLGLELEDTYAPDEFVMSALPVDSSWLPKVDSLLDYMANNRKEGLTSLFGGGIGKRLEDGNLVSDEEQISQDNYPGLTKKDKEKRRMSDEYRRLRITKGTLFIDGTVNIQLSSYTDPVISNLASKDTLIARIMEEKKILTGNAMLSMLRTMNVLDLLIKTLQTRLSQRTDISLKSMSAVSELLTTTRDKAKVFFRNHSLTYKEYELIRESVLSGAASSP